MSDAGTAAQGDARPPLVERLSGFVALFGGLLSLGIAGLVVVSVIGRKFFNSPINGDFEMVQMATAIAVFSFLRLLPGPPRQHRGGHLHDLAAAPRQRLHRCVLGPRLRRHDGPDRLLHDVRRASSTTAAARPPCCCRSSSGRRWRICTALAFCWRWWRWRPPPGSIAAGAAMSGLASRRHRLRRHAGADRAADAGRAVDAGGGRRRLHPPVELGGVLRLHEDQSLLPVRQLHAVGHSAVHPDGRAGRACRHLHQPVHGRARPSPAACAAGWRWR